MRKAIMLIVVFNIILVSPLFILAEDNLVSDINREKNAINFQKELPHKKLSTALFWDMVPILTIGAWGAVCFTLESEPRGDDDRASCLEGFPLLGPFLFSLSYIPIDIYSQVPKPGIIAFSTVKILLSLAYLPFGFAVALSDIERDDYQEEYDERWKMIKESWLIWGSSLLLIQTFEFASQSIYINKYNEKISAGMSFIPELRRNNEFFLTLNYSF